MRRMLLVMLASTLLFGSAVRADDAAGAKIENAEIGKKAQDFLDNGDSYQLLESLTAGNDPVAATQKFYELVGKLYMEAKNVPQMVMCGRAGIQFALDRAEQIKVTDPQTADKLRGLAKTIAYDVSVNCWPGWGDEGIAINNSDLAVGLDLARLNLRLAGELKRDDFVHGNAHWLVGAHWLAMGKRKPALDAFEKSTEHFQTAGKPEYEWMAKGYLGLANLLDPAEQKTGEQQIQEARQALSQMNSEDAKFFSEQLTGVRKILIKR